MGLFDKLKGAINFVTGGGARVVLEIGPGNVVPGTPHPVRIHVSSTGGEVRATGLALDLAANERVHVPASRVHHGTTNQPGQHGSQLRGDVNLTHATFQQAIPVSGPVNLAPNETKSFEATIVVPPHAQPTYIGHHCRHEWSVRARLEVSGNDPDSGFVPIQVTR